MYRGSKGWIPKIAVPDSLGSRVSGLGFRVIDLKMIVTVNSGCTEAAVVT